MTARSRTHLWIAWALLTALGLAFILFAAARSAREAKAHWQEAVQASSQRPQQFFQNWLEYRRQLLRSVVQRSRGQGWETDKDFSEDLTAVSTDSDGVIELSVAAARVDDQRTLRVISLDGVSVNEWLELRQRGPGPVGTVEGLQAPLKSGRVPLHLPINANQQVWLMLDVGALFTQLQDLDWPQGLSLRLSLIDGQGQQSAVWSSPFTSEVLHRFSAEAASAFGRWQFEWSVSAANGPDFSVAWTWTVLGSISWLSFSGFSFLLLRSAMTLRLRNSELQVLNANISVQLQHRLPALNAAHERARANERQLLELNWSKAVGGLLQAQVDLARPALEALARRAAQLARDLDNAPPTETAKPGAGAEPPTLAWPQRDRASHELWDITRNANELTRDLSEQLKPWLGTAPERVRLCSLLDPWLKKIGPQLQEAHCILSYKADGAVQVQTQAAALLLMLQLLLDNIVARAVQRSAVPEVQLGFRQEGEQVLIWLQDCAQPFDASTLKRFLTADLRLPSEGDAPGWNGFLAHSLASGLLDAELTLCKSDETGTRFELRLPA